MTETDKITLLGEIKIRAAAQNRLLVGISGPPGSGKSTVAGELADGLGPAAVVIPMDGFHLDNARLEQLDLLHRKGAPETFDAAGFVALIRKLRGKKTIRFPTFDREADRAVSESGLVDADIRIVLIEGNYLLLNIPPWNSLADTFDLTVRLEVSRDVLEARLVRRWHDLGFCWEDARARALANDMKNADHVDRHSRVADFTMRTG